MKKLKFVVLSLGLLTFASCDKNDDEVISNEPKKENQMKNALGAIFEDDATYQSHEKVDVAALVRKYKNMDETSAKASLPSSHIISGTVPGNQGNEGSCVAWTVAYAGMSALEKNFRGITQPRSPEYVYNQIKAGTNCNSGSTIANGLNLIKNQGVCSWDEMPYTDIECSTQPNASQKNAASTHKSVSWATVSATNLQNVKTLLSMNLPIYIGVQVDASFDGMANTGWIWKNHSGAVRGGHAVCVIGYDDSKQAFKVQNSWGANWGEGGYFWIDYNFFKKSFNGAVMQSYVAYVQ